MPQKDNTTMYVLAGAAALFVCVLLSLFVWYLTTLPQTTPAPAVEPPPVQPDGAAVTAADTSSQTAADTPVNNNNPPAPVTTQSTNIFAPNYVAPPASTGKQFVQGAPKDPAAISTAKNVVFSRCEGETCDQCPQGYVETKTVCPVLGAVDRKQCWHPIVNTFNRRVCKTRAGCQGDQAGVVTAALFKAAGNSMVCPIGYKPQGSWCTHRQTGHMTKPVNAADSMNIYNARNPKAHFKKLNASTKC